MSAITIESLFHDYVDDLYAWACLKVNNVEDAQDLVQETFIAANKGLKDFKQLSTPKTWLMQILKHKIIDYYHKKTSKTRFTKTNFQRL